MRTRQSGAQTFAVAGVEVLPPMKRGSARFSVWGNAAQFWLNGLGLATQLPAFATEPSAMQNVGALPARSGHEPAHEIVQNPAG